MLIIDFNQIIISSLMAQLKSDKTKEINENLVRHIVLSNILHLKKKFPEYKEIVLAADDKNYWRKDFFPYYKAQRKKWRDDSEFDWNLIFNCLNKIRNEVSETFPYKVIRVEKAEADDIIATLSIDKSRSGESVMIVSADKDFVQLQRFDNIRQYSPFMNRFLNHPNPLEFLKEHILQGDRGDGVPNFLSADDTFVSDKNQKPIRKEKLATWLKSDPKTFCDDIMFRNFKRNEQIIDLTKIPEDIKDKVRQNYSSYIIPSRNKLFPYFVENQLNLLLEDINDF